MLQPHLKWLQDFRMFNLIYPMSNINILDHHFYFKTQRGRIKSQPINSEVSHYHLRLLLGTKEAPWWWPLKAPYGVFASLGRKIKAWVRGVGFLMCPLEWWSSSHGLTGCMGWRNGSPRHGEGCEVVHSGLPPSPSECDSRGARGYRRVDTDMCSRLSMQFLATWGPDSHVESPGSLDISHLWKSQPLVRNQTENGRWKPHWHLLKAGGTSGEPVLYLWGCKSKPTFTRKKI